MRAGGGDSAKLLSEVAALKETVRELQLLLKHNAVSLLLLSARRARSTRPRQMPLVPASWHAMCHMRMLINILRISFLVFAHLQNNKRSPYSTAPHTTPAAAQQVAADQTNLALDQTNLALAAALAPDDVESIVASLARLSPICRAEMDVLKKKRDLAKYHCSIDMADALDVKLGPWIAEVEADAPILVAGLRALAGIPAAPAALPLNQQETKRLALAIAQLLQQHDPGFKWPFGHSLALVLKASTMSANAVNIAAAVVPGMIGNVGLTNWVASLAKQMMADGHRVSTDTDKLVEFDNIGLYHLFVMAFSGNFSDNIYTAFAVYHFDKPFADAKLLTKDRRLQPGSYPKLNSVEGTPGYLPPAFMALSAETRTRGGVEKFSDVDMFLGTVQGIISEGNADLEAVIAANGDVDPIVRGQDPSTIEPQVRAAATPSCPDWPGLCLHPPVSRSHMDPTITCCVATHRSKLLHFSVLHSGLLRCGMLRCGMLRCGKLHRRTRLLL